jgi:hypothetical protein
MLNRHIEALLREVGPEPEICKYEQMREKPGPFYQDDKWYESADGQ